jgi:Siphovirus Gp157
MRIEEALAQLHGAADLLREQFPGLVDDDAAWLDTIDGITDGLDLAEYLAERAIMLVSMQAAALDRAKALQARAKRFEAEEDRLKGIILALVEAAGGKKVVRSSVTLSPRNTPPKVVAIDEAATPAQYMIEVVSQRADKKAIRDALEIGAEVDGWMLTNGGRTIALLVR